MMKAAEFGEGEGALLPWESKPAFAALRQEFYREHAPEGPTEQALVDRLVWIEWRRRRLALAERAVHMAGLAERLDDEQRTMKRAGLRSQAARERLGLDHVLTTTAADDVDTQRDHAADRKASARALSILEHGGADAYARALAALHPETRSWWEDGLAGEYGDERAWVADAECLEAFLREEVTPADDAMELANAARPAVRLQAFGESLNPDRIERLMAIEARLDRQFEKSLSMLIQLRRMRPRKPLRVGRGVGRDGVALDSAGKSLFQQARAPNSSTDVVSSELVRKAERI